MALTLKSTQAPSGGGSSALSSITASTTSNSVTHGNFDQLWTFPQTTGIGLTLVGSSLTTGSTFSVIGTSTSLTGAGTVASIKYNATAKDAHVFAVNMNNDAPTNGLFVRANNRVGILTSTPSAALHVNGAVVLESVSISDLPTGGSIGSAASTVDMYSTIFLNQTTVGQTITIPTPTVTTAGRIIWIQNKGTAGVRLVNSSGPALGPTGTPMSGLFGIYDGSAWSFSYSLVRKTFSVGTTQTIVSPGGANIDVTAGTGIYVVTIDTSVLANGDMFYIKDATGAINNTNAVQIKTSSGNIDGVSGSSGYLMKSSWDFLVLKWNGTVMQIMGSANQWTNNTLTGSAFSFTANSLTSGTLMSLSSGSTAATNNSKGLDIALSGALSTSSVTSYAANISNTRTGTTNTNVGLSVSASGGTNNYGLLVTGSAGFGITAPTAPVHAYSSAGGTQYPLKVEVSGGNCVLELYNSGNAKAYHQLLGSTGNVYWYTSTTSGALGSLRLIMSASGNFTVGNTNLDTSKFSIEASSLGTTQTYASGLSVVSVTNASAGAQQISPAVRWRGNGWKTNATAGSQPVDFQAYVVPVQGTAAPTSYLTFETSVNGGSFTNVFTVDSGGKIGVNTTAPAGIIDVVSTTMPAYPFPRMTTTQRNALTGMAEGAVIYNTTNHLIEFWNGTAWTAS